MKRRLIQQKEQHEKSRSAGAARNREMSGLTEAQAEKIEKVTKDFRDNTKVLQKESHYYEGNKYHHYLPGCVMDTLEEGHPKFTTLKLDWTWTGEWLGVPKTSTANIKEGEEVHSYHVARKEKYVDGEGNIKEAMAYGKSSTALIVWYDFEELKSFFKN